MRVKTAPKTFDIFINSSGSWKFLYTLEADNIHDARDTAMKEHKIVYDNTIAVYPKK
jgi:Fe-S cluster assembly iron-binding protein IscA